MKHLSKSKYYYLPAICISIVIIEAVVHAAIFHGGVVADSLLLNVSGHEMYIRLLVIVASVMLCLLLFKNQIIKEQKFQLENILNSIIPICITNRNYEIIQANDAYWSIWEKPRSKTIKCYDHRPGPTCHTRKCALTQVIGGAEQYVCESKKEHGKDTSYYLVTARPFLDSDQKTVGVIESFQDITDRKALETERENLINQLQTSLEKVKLLKGLLPICASCKKIRDDKGYWNKLEAYISEHSEAKFSHFLCPDCAQKLYPDLQEDTEKTS